MRKTISTYQAINYIRFIIIIIQFIKINDVVIHVLMKKQLAYNNLNGMTIQFLNF